jgi:hypothetical protein
MMRGKEKAYVTTRKEVRLFSDATQRRFRSGARINLKLSLPSVDGSTNHAPSTGGVWRSAHIKITPDMQ